MSTASDPAQATLDQRREQRNRAAEQILAHAQHLAQADRELVEQVYEQGQSVRRIARMSGMPAHRLQRRLTRLLTRMRQPLFRFVATRGELLPRETAATARRVVLQGRSLRETARVTGLSLHRVRQHMATVRDYYRLTSL